MQRPMMDPTFVKDLVDAKKRGLPYWDWAKRSAKWFGRSLISNPLIVRRPDDPWKPSLSRVMMRMTISWVIFLPTLIGLTSVVLVLMATHPAPVATVADPNSQGCYFDPASFTSTDGTQLSGWMIPVVDAKRVLEERDHVLTVRRPAIVLLHDFGQSPQEMLPLVRPLHDEGMLVLVVALRGTGSRTMVGQTFGLNEAKDVEAAVEMLRQNPFVDPKRIAVAGIGTGGNAALLAASRDPQIAAMIIANPVKNCDQLIDQRIVPNKPWLKWMEPLCRRTFELIYHVDGADINFDQYANVLRSRPTLVFDTGDSFVLHEGTTINQIRLFCRRHLNTRDLPSFGSGR